MTSILEIENVSKQYKLGQIGTGTLSHDINRWWHSIRGKEDPYLQVGDVNDRTKKATSQYVWALKEVDFTVSPGEVLGIIGRNGAGKSTLLKILSRVTGPSTGRIISRGRIASLLEVGVGFHPELTGKENIFLNGAILGMSKAEISSKLEEIIEFSGCERYIDTPVKRYSSGMFVRLAFAVAAHLEPDILIVDEVLAVGDAEFQKKALGKMKSVSKESGRTVLFVSHNMAAVKSLCTRGIVLEKGTIAYQGEINDCIKYYLNNNAEIGNYRNLEASPIQQAYYTLFGGQVQSKQKTVTDPICIDEEVLFSLPIEIKPNAPRIDITIKVKDEEGNFLFVSSTADMTTPLPAGIHQVSCIFPKNLFNIGVFYIDVLVIEDIRNLLERYDDFLSFVMVGSSIELGGWMHKTEGALKPKLSWQVSPTTII